MNKIDKLWDKFSLIASFLCILYQCTDKQKWSQYWYIGGCILNEIVLESLSNFIPDKELAYTEYRFPIATH